MNANMQVLMSVPGGQPFLHLSFAIVLMFFNGYYCAAVTIRINIHVMRAEPTAALLKRFVGVRYHNGWSEHRAACSPSFHAILIVTANHFCLTFKHRAGIKKPIASILPSAV